MQYGTACGNSDLSQFVNNTSLNGIRCVYGDFSEEELLRIIGIDARPIAVNGFDPLLICADGR